MSPQPTPKSTPSTPKYHFTTIKLVGQDGYEVKMKVKSMIAFRKIKNTFASRLNTTPSAFKLYYDGARVNDRDTIESLGVDEGDVIEVYSHQTGGGCGRFSSFF